MAIDLQQKLLTAEEQINSRSPRERVIIFAVIIAVIYFALDTYFITPQLQLQQELTDSNQKLQQESLELELVIAEIMKKHQFDPDSQTKRQLENAKAQVAQLDSSLQNAVSGIIPTDIMAAALEQILQKYPSINFISLKNIDAQPITTANPDDPEAPPLTIMYRHGIELVFEANFRQATSYLQEIEQLPWKFGWQKITMQQQEYPTVRIAVDLYTLSLQRGFLDV